MKLYSGPLSLFTAKVRIVLAEKEIDYELVSVPFDPVRGYEPKHPDVVRLNPKRQVPVLVDGAISIYDSTLINEYLDEVRLEPPLLPRDPAARALCRQQEAASDEIFFPHVWTLIREIFYRRDANARDVAAIEEAREGIASFHASLDALLADRRPHLSGEPFTVADVATFLTSTYATWLGSPPAGSLTSLSAWLERVGSRESVAREIAEMSRYRDGATRT